MIDDNLSLPFDLYTRNEIITQLVSEIRGRSPLKILDVGGRNGQLTSFFSRDSYYILDIRFPEKKDDVRYAIGDCVKIPFKDKSFDIVISSDMYEHLSQENRKKAIIEMRRVSKNLIILAAPFHSDAVEQAEINANEFFLRNTGKEHPWLKEHIVNVLPSCNELETFLADIGCEFVKIGTNTILNWLFLQLFIFYAYSYGTPSDKIDAVYRFYNENFEELGDFLEPTYRKIYLIGKIGTVKEVECARNKRPVDTLKQERLNVLVFDALSASTKAREYQIRNLENRVNILEQEIEEMKESIIWQMTTRFHNNFVEKMLPRKSRQRGWYELGRKGCRVLINEGCRGFLCQFKRYIENTRNYKKFIRNGERSEAELDKIREECRGYRYRPKISIITPVWNTEEKHLRLAIESVLNQIYDNWELCIVDGGSTKLHVNKILKEYTEMDNRIRVKFLPENLGIAGNSNQALAMATGEFAGFLDHDDELTPFALYEVIKLLNDNPGLDFIYSDEDKIDEGGNKSGPFFKPDWSPDMFLSANYLCHFSVIRRVLIDDVGRFRKGYEGSQDYDLFLRILERTCAERIAHIPKILYHWRTTTTSVASSPNAKPYAYTSAKKALKDAMARRKIEIDAINEGMWIGSYRIKYRIVDNPKISVIIPNKDKIDVLKTCIESILDKTLYDNYEIFVVDSNSEEEGTFVYYDKIKTNSKIKLLYFNKPFNFSAINNYAVSEVDSEYILFLNSDTEVITPEWLNALLEMAQRSEVGAVGARLLYPDNTIQHAGLITGLGGVAGHAHKRLLASNPGYFGRAQIIQNLTAVTGACLLTKKSIFVDVGGLDEKNLAIAFNDVDYCLKLRQKGYLVVYTPFATLYHHESLYRWYEDTPEKRKRFAGEVTYMKKKWGRILDNDPYYNPNLTLDKEDFSIRVR